LSNPLVLVLSTQRLTQLVVEDEITRPLRVAVEKWAAGYPENSLRERVDFAVNCGACASVWTAAAVLIADQFPAGRVLLRILAASAAALGVKAVLDKLEA
jgi:hypothetical protein